MPGKKKRTVHAGENFENVKFPRWFNQQEIGRFQDKQTTK